MASDAQATDERTFDDARLHLKKAIALMDLVFDGRLNVFDKDKTLHLAHDHVVKAYNTVAFLSEKPNEHQPSS
jgi:hypothetical protein